MHFGAEAVGNGAGAAEETLMLVNAESPIDDGPLRYGAVIALRCRAARERLLSFDGSGALSFRGVVISNSNKWTVLRPGAVGRAGPRGMRAPVALASSAAAAAAVLAAAALGRDAGAGADAAAGAGAGRSEEPAFALAVTSADPAGGEGDRRAWHVSRAGTPYLPPWTQSRPYLTGDFLVDLRRPGAGQPWVPPPPPPSPKPAAAGPGGATGAAADGPTNGAGCAVAGLSGGGGGSSGSGADGESLPSGLPTELQEMLLLEDLLGALVGLEGRLVRIRGRAAPPIGDGGGDSGSGAAASPFGWLAAAEFVVEDGVDEQLAYLAERVLPLCDDYVRVARFVADGARYERGLVTHALTAAVRALLREYLLLAAQLEAQARQGRLTLQRLWYALQPSMRSMRALRGLAEAVGGRRGGNLLEGLGEAARGAGDAGIRRLFDFLLERAAAPYFEMLTLWIYHGELDDPYGEFMVREEDSFNKSHVEEDYNAQYWEGRYTLQHHNILTTGKYLNVVRECGRQVRCPFAAPISPAGSSADTSIAEAIERAYDFASRTLLELVMGEERLRARLRSMKHYFLLDRGDFFVHFMDVAAE
ncbi:unnamed protein product, partial [Phaeothamnion confervicola]